MEPCKAKQKPMKGMLRVNEIINYSSTEVRRPLKAKKKNAVCEVAWDAVRGLHGRHPGVCLSLAGPTRDSSPIQPHYCSSVKGPLGKNVPFHTQTLLHSETGVGNGLQKN